MAKKKRRRRTPVATTKKTSQRRDDAPRPPSTFNDRQLLEETAKLGSKLLEAAREQLSTVPPITDDDRWGAPFPLRFESQFAILILGSLDAFDVTVEILRTRASQQAFGTLRFQMETLALLRWMTDSTDERERQSRAYRVLCGQISRWARFLMRDAGRDRAALQGVRAIREWGKHLRELAAQDDVDLEKRVPNKDSLFTKYGKRSGGIPRSACSPSWGHIPARRATSCSR